MLLRCPDCGGKDQECPRCEGTGLICEWCGESESVCDGHCGDDEAEDEEDELSC